MPIVDAPNQFVFIIENTYSPPPSLNVGRRCLDRFVAAGLSCSVLANCRASQSIYSSICIATPFLSIDDGILALDLATIRSGVYKTISCMGNVPPTKSKLQQRELIAHLLDAVRHCMRPAVADNISEGIDGLFADCGKRHCLELVQNPVLPTVLWASYSVVTGQAVVVVTGKRVLLTKAKKLTALGQSHTAFSLYAWYGPCGSNSSALTLTKDQVLVDARAYIGVDLMNRVDCVIAVSTDTIVWRADHVANVSDSRKMVVAVGGRELRAICLAKSAASIFASVAERHIGAGIATKQAERSRQWLTPSLTSVSHL